VEKEKEEKHVAPWVLADFWFGFVVVSDFGRCLEEEAFVGGEGKGRVVRVLNYNDLAISYFYLKYNK
jgi:hypothetical protein